MQLSVEFFYQHSNKVGIVLSRKTRQHTFVAFARWFMLVFAGVSSGGKLRTRRPPLPPRGTQNFRLVQPCGISGDAATTLLLRSLIGIGTRGAYAAQLQIYVCHSIPPPAASRDPKFRVCGLLRVCIRIFLQTPTIILLRSTKVLSRINFDYTCAVDTVKSIFC